MVNLDRAIIRLLCEPGPWAELCRQPDLVPTAVEELLRLGGPVSIGGLPRYTRCPVEVGDQTIPAGDAVILANAIANFDPAVYPDGDDMNLARTPNPHVSFGHGAHFCLGASLARIELQEALAALVRHYPTLRLAVPVEELVGSVDTLTSGYDRLPVTWD